MPFIFYLFYIGILNLMHILFLITVLFFLLQVRPFFGCFLANLEHAIKRSISVLLK